MASTGSVSPDTGSSPPVSSAPTPVQNDDRASSPAMTSGVRLASLSQNNLSTVKSYFSVLTSFFSFSWVADLWARIRGKYVPPRRVEASRTDDEYIQMLMNRYKFELNQGIRERNLDLLGKWFDNDTPTNRADLLKTLSDFEIYEVLDLTIYNIQVTGDKATVKYVRTDHFVAAGTGYEDTRSVDVTKTLTRVNGRWVPGKSI